MLRYLVVFIMFTCLIFAGIFYLKTNPESKGVDVLGYIVFPHQRLLRNDNGHRFFRRLRTFAKASRSGKVHFLAFKPNIGSWIGHARHANTYGLRYKIFSQVIFKGGPTSKT